MTAYTYFTFSNGLRGCYMPDSVYPVRFKRRKDLIEFVRDEASARLEGEWDVPASERIVGLSKRAVTAFACEAWARRNDRRWTMDLALGFGTKAQGPAFGLFLSRSNRADYDAAVKEMD